MSHHAFTLIYYDYFPKGCRVFGEAELFSIYLTPTTLVGLVLLLASTWAHADAEDTFNLNVGMSVMHDDNLFRLSSDVDPQAVLGKPTKSDRITSTSVGLRVNKPYGLQRFELDATLIDYRYQTFSYLNFTASNYAAAWRWKLTPYVYGNLTSSRKESLNSFSDYTNYINPNIRTDGDQRFDGVFEIDGAWHLIGGIAQYTRTNSQIFVQEGDNQVNSADVGIRYDFPSGTSLSYRSKSGRGDYTNRPQPIAFGLYDNHFDDREDELRLRWALTGKASLDARAAYLERTHEHYAARDYAGKVGNLNVIWQITGKTSLTASLARELTSYQSLYSSYISTDRLTLTPYWQINAKIALRLRYGYAQRDYRGAIANTPLNDRVDTERICMIALEWQPLRTLSVSTSLQSDRRDSNRPGLDYKSAMVNVSAQVSF